jgi:hypothetical protein
MNGKTGALAVVAAVAVLTAACGASSPAASRSVSAGSAAFQENVAFAQCIQTHGAPGFPDPTVVNGSLHFDVDIQSPQYQAPLNACRSLLPKGVKLP